METFARKFKFSGRVASDDRRHLVQAKADTVIAPHNVYVPGVGNVPQYAATMASSATGYNPAADCEGYFMSFKFQPNNNCYAYSCNVASNSFAQPGRMHGYLIPDPPAGPSVRTGAEKDGLIWIGAQLSQVKNHSSTQPGGHYVALLISPADTPNQWPGDYHWVRCDDNSTYRSWSQKDGNDQVTNFDFAGKPIVDPSTANWSVNQGPITAQNVDDLVVKYAFYGYMFVPWGKVSII